MDFWFLIIGIFFTLFLIVGTVGNTIMLMAFIRSAKLRTICHFLIAFLCLADLMHSLCHVVNVITNFLGISIKQSTCFNIQAFFLIGALSSSPICFLLGLDRFIAIGYPFYYQQLQRKKLRTLLIYSLFPLFYTTFILQYSYKRRTKEELRICAIPTALNSEAFTLLNLSFMGIQGLACVFYFISWIQLKKKTVEKTFRRIFKSIVITVLLIIFGWFTTGIINSLSFIWIEKGYQRLIVQMFAGFFVNASLCTNIFVYYYRNVEYKKAIRSVICKEEEVSENVDSAQRQRMLESNV